MYSLTRRLLGNQSRTLFIKTNDALPIFSMLGYAKVKAQAQSETKKKAEPQKKKKQLPTMTAPRKEKPKVKIILTENVPGLGFKGEHLSAAKGYSRNFLFPKSLAVHDTPQNTAAYEEFTKQIDPEAKEKAKQLQKAKKKLAKIVVNMKRKEMPDGSMHSNITIENVIEKLAKQHRLEIAREQIRLENGTITTYGKYPAIVTIDGAEGSITIDVQRR